MSGLLLKDWYVTRKNCRLHMGIILLMTALSLVRSVGMFYLSYAVLFAGMIPIYTLSVDEKQEWNAYALTLPYGRRDIVTGKYIYALLTLAASTALALVLWGVRAAITGESFGVVLRFSAMMLAFGLVFPAGSLPFMFRLGVEKGRVAMMAILIVFLALYFSVSGVFQEGGGQVSEIITAASPLLLPVMLLLFFLSWLITVKLFEKREF